MLAALPSPQTEIATLAGHALRLIIAIEEQVGQEHLINHLTPEQRLKRAATYQSLGDPRVIAIGM
jgi:hypothetical protein